MTDKLVAFLRACVKADEDAALAAIAEGTNGEWSEYQNPDGVTFVEDEHTTILCIQDMPSRPFRHIARHDPARVMREITAKRAIIDAWQHYEDRGEDEFVDDPRWDSGAHTALTDALRHLAAVYADRDGYEEAVKG